MDGYRPRCRLFKLSLLLACGVWFMDAAADSYFSGGVDWYERLWPQDPKELLMRSFVVVLLAAFGRYAESVAMQRRRDTQDLRLARKIFERASEAILVTDSQNRIVDVNRALERLSGYKRAELLGHNPSTLSSGRHDRRFYDRMWDAISTTGHWNGEVWDQRKNGEIYPKWMSIDTVFDDAGRVLNYFAIMKDISSLKREQAELASLAYYDPLTNLPNRRLLEDRLQRALMLAERNASSVAVLFIDLDGFKPVNDSFGHRAGDGLLNEAAARICRITRGADTLARFAGDEFVLMLPELRKSEGEAMVAEKVCASLARPFRVDGHELYIGASIGIAIYPHDADCASELIRRADSAMYRAKRNGRGQYCYYESDVVGAGTSAARKGERLKEE